MLIMTFLLILFPLQSLPPWTITQVLRGLGLHLLEGIRTSLPGSQELRLCVADAKISIVHHHCIFFSVDCHVSSAVCTYR